jgi:pyruvate,orthophosphate dikinase
MEKIMGTKFGATSGMPLLVAVRSGARDSMPGMMDTILNLGSTTRPWSRAGEATNNPRFAWDCYRRFIQMYGDVVWACRSAKVRITSRSRSSSTTSSMRSITRTSLTDSKSDRRRPEGTGRRFKALVKERTGKVSRTIRGTSLRGAAGAVFGSWMNDRAIVYRRKYNIPSEWGTAVNVQAMVFGNTGDTSGSGVAFTSNPANGQNEFYGEFLINAQGEDVVAGVRTPEPVAKLEDGRCPSPTPN